MAKFGSNAASPAACQPCGKNPPPMENPNLHWVEIELVYEGTGKPVADEEYLVKLEDGTERRGRLNDQGFAREANIESPGSCQITFPNFDKDVWEPCQ